MAALLMVLMGVIHLVDLLVPGKTPVLILHYYCMVSSEH